MRHVVLDEMESAPRDVAAASVTADFVRTERTATSQQVAALSIAFVQQAPPEFTPLPGKFLKHYEIIRKLGQGGMGVVLLARANPPFCALA